MAAKRGDALLIKIGDGGSPESFTSVAGLRTKTITVNGETVDITSADDTQKWRQLLEGAGVKSMSVSGSGVLKDDTVMGTINTAVINQSIDTWQVIVPGIGTFEGQFQPNQIEYGGEHNGEAVYTISLESAGNLAFTAA